VIINNIHMSNSSHPRIYSSYKNLGPSERFDGFQQEKDHINPPQREEIRDENGTFAVMQPQSQEHRKKILTQNAVVVVYLWGSYCPPCRAIAPEYAKLAQEYNNAGKCMLIKEDVDLGLTKDYQATGIPAFIFYVGGQLLKNNDGQAVAIIGGDLKKVRGILDQILARFSDQPTHSGQRGSGVTTNSNMTNRRP
jgi:thioredoxin 1